MHGLADLQQQRPVFGSGIRSRVGGVGDWVDLIDERPASEAGAAKVRKVVGDDRRGGRRDGLRCYELIVQLEKLVGRSASSARGPSKSMPRGLSALAPGDGIDANTYGRHRCAGNGSGGCSGCADSGSRSSRGRSRRTRPATADPRSVTQASVTNMLNVVRPAGPHHQVIPVRLSEDSHRRLKEWCAEHNFPMAVVVRGLIERFLDSWQDRAA